MNRVGIAAALLSIVLLPAGVGLALLISRWMGKRKGDTDV